MARARKFYEKTLGLKLGANYRNLWVEYYPGGTACFALTTMVRGLKPAANVAFEVADLEEALKSLRKAKVRIVGKVHDTPVCRMASCRDTEGNAITLNAKKS
ncbi:MAG: VOC family protein [Elusimicrobia bacterium]|nr:VOC family protein [Elusimicrobiota bacterium]